LSEEQTKIKVFTFFWKKIIDFFKKYGQNILGQIALAPVLKNNLGKLAWENFAKDNLGKSHLSL
jgi:hypothetical protein